MNIKEQKLLPQIKKLFSTGFFHIFGGNVINKVITFVSGIILVHLLSKPEYGVFTYAWNIYGIVFLFSGMGMDSSMLQLSSEHGGEPKYTKSVCSYSTKFGLLFNILLTLALLIIALFCPLKIEAGRPLIFALCLLPLFQFLFSMMSQFLRSQKQNKEFATLAVINTSICFVVSVGACLLLKAMGLVVGYYAAAIISIAFGILVYKVRLYSKDTIDTSADKKALLSIGLVSMVNNGLSQLMYLLDVFVLGIVDPQETLLASYKVATIIPTALTFIPQSLMVYVYPYFAEHKDDGEWCLKRYRQILLGIGAFNLFISGVLCLGAPLIIRLIFGYEYLDAVPVFIILSINYFISGTFRIVSGNLLVTQRRLKFNLLVAIVSSVTNIIADYFFIQWWGSMGAAFATVLVVIISSIMSTARLIYSFKHAGIGVKANTGKGQEQ